MKVLSAIAAAACVLSFGSAAAAEHSCAGDARERAAKLLAFHSEEDPRAEIDREVKPVPGIKNPANPKQRFDVLEVWGSIYKGQYRMRFIYAQMPGCVLMGQELLEHADL